MTGRDDLSSQSSSSRAVVRERVDVALDQMRAAGSSQRPEYVGAISELERLLAEVNAAHADLMAAADHAPDLPGRTRMMGIFERLGAQLSEVVAHTPGEEIDQARRVVARLAAVFSWVTSPGENPDVVGAIARLRHASAALSTALAHAHRAVAHMGAFVDVAGVVRIHRDLPPVAAESGEPDFDGNRGQETLFGEESGFNRESLYSRLPEWGRNGGDATYGYRETLTMPSGNSPLGWRRMVLTRLIWL